MATKESNPFEKLSRDLITEILSRLPVKSLLKSSCVSRSWHSHISSPEFQTTYLQVSNTRPRLVFGSASALYTCSLSHIFDEHPFVDDALLDFASHDPYDMIQIAGSCNGLVCLVFLRTGYIIIWNPAIRKYRRLPSPWPNNLRERYGFGYDASSYDYKVLHIVHESDSTSYSRIYSLRNNSWKSSHWPRGMTTFGRSGMFMNGAIHWIVHYNDNINGATVWAVVAQSLARGHFVWNVELPLQRDESRVMSAFLGVLGERLCVCLDCGFEMEVWVMEEYGVEGCWSKVFCMDNYDLGMDPLIVTEKGVVTTKIDSSLVSHILFGNREIIHLNNNNYVRAITYAESFVNPNLFHVVEAFGSLKINFFTLKNYLL
ncbi:F-box/kelch-repeat protein At3g23880-like [Henckelia pumila]|uniref:F-box/kelch-repeat protein At3g23880-like n=1 Tax=Henckelia pumila TaxID=405737 RepID=UPI003C6E7A30